MWESIGTNCFCKMSNWKGDTFMIYLNDGFKGGGTNFPNQNMVVVPETGKAVTWENIKDGKVLEEYMHEGVALEEGKKYIITAWWRENDWDGAGDEKLYQDSYLIINVSKRPEGFGRTISEALSSAKILS